MDSIKSMLVCLDLTEMDEILITYARFYCQKVPVEKVYFVHNIKIYALGEDFMEEYGNVDLATEVEKEIDNLVAKHFDDIAPHEVLVSEDPNTEVILSDVVHQYKIPLTMVGRKNQLEGSGALGIKLMKILPSNVLVVPEEATHAISRILVPIDFSKGSNKALKTGFALARHWEVPAEALHVYRLTSQYFPMVSEAEAVKRTENHIRKKFEEFKKKHPEYSPMKFSYKRAAGLSIAGRIQDYLHHHNNDFVVLGHRGSNPLHVLKLGTVPAELYTLDLPVPVLMVYS